MADDKKPDDEKKQRQPAPKLVPNAEGNVIVEALMGPYRGQHLTMTAADGDAAISGHWARNPVEALYEHEALSDEERTAAFEASHTWAKAQWDAAQNVEPPPEAKDAEGRQRTMRPEETTGGYQTRRHQGRPV